MFPQIGLSQDLFKDPNFASEKLAKIKKNFNLVSLEEKWAVDPGEATITGKPYLKSIPEADHSKFIQGAKIKIFEYTGKGYSQIELAGTRFRTKIARSKKRCNEKPDLYWSEYHSLTVMAKLCPKSLEHVSDRSGSV